MNRNNESFRDKLVFLTEYTNPQKPCNVKRKSLNKHSFKGGNSSKLSMQDFVRMDPCYTTDIEHLVFPSKKRNTQPVAPLNSTAGKTRSRLAEMFALSRHLQQKSADRESKMRNPTINRSVDSALDSRKASRPMNIGGSRPEQNSRRWATPATVEEPVRQNSSSARISATADSGMSTARGPNVSVLHLRSTSNPWETSPTSVFTSAQNYRPCPTTGRSNTFRSLTKHQSLVGPDKWNSYSGFHSGEEVNSTDLFVTGTCSRELSPVRWCDREVDGVYLGRSGWVQVQQRSLDENRRTACTSNFGAATTPLQASRRTGIKLAQYHCMSEPGKCPEYQRPFFLPLQKQEYQRTSPPPPPPPQSYSPPSVTPIISPPPAFQDRKNNLTKSRTFFGKTPFLPRSDAIVDSDASPPATPPQMQKKLTPSPVPPPRKQVPPEQTYRIPQTKSLEDTSNRRTQFTQRYGGSSSSSSSSLGFKSLDSCVNRPAMPRLSENTDSSIDIYEDADDEDNNSSSLNLSIVSSVTVKSSVNKEKLSPSNRSSRLHHRQYSRKSPVGEGKQLGKSNSSSSFSSSSPEHHSKSPSNPPPARRLVQNRQPLKPNTEDANTQRVRRSRSLQLPEKKPIPGIQNRISPQLSDNLRTKKLPGAKIQPLDNKVVDENILREAEVVTEFLYGSRSRAAAQALLKHRYNNGLEEPAGVPKPPLGNGYNVFIVQNQPKPAPKVLQRGATSPNIPPIKPAPCSSDSCDFWPHCNHRSSINNPTQSMMKVSQSYPMHQRSLDTNPEGTKTLLDPKDLHKKRSCSAVRSLSDVKNEDFPQMSRMPYSVEVSERRVSPKNLSAGSGSEYDRNASPMNLRHTSPNFGNSSNSSSSSDVWITTSDGTVAKSPRNKSSRESTPLDSASLCQARENILTRPGSAPAEKSAVPVGLVEAQQRSLSLPKSFLSASSCLQGGRVTWDKRGSESLRSSPGVCRKTLVQETSHTAPVTPSHEIQRRRSPLSGSAVRRTKAASTPQLLDPPENRTWDGKVNSASEPLSCLNPVDIKDVAARRNLNTETVLQKFRKTFGLRFQKKGSKESNGSKDGDSTCDVPGDPSEEDSPQHVPHLPIDEQIEQKYRFGPLTWRTSKERKKMNKAARSAKCNSGDSGIQIEMAPNCGAGGDSSESHDTDPPGDELDSPPALRRRPPHGKSSRPHSDLLNQILIDKFKAELKSRTKHSQVRRTHSDLGGQRLLQWDPRSTYRRMMSSPAPLRGRPQSPRKKPPDLPGGVQLRYHPKRGHLRRSLSQPLDIDKLSPLMRTKTAGLRIGGINVLSEDEHDGRGISDDEIMISDSESSVASISERKKSLELAMDEDVVILAEAVFDHVAIEAEELAFRAGNVIEVLETVNRDWWWGSADGKSGWFPAAFVRLRVSQEDTVEDCLAAMASGHSVPAHLRRRTSISLLSNDQVRTSVVRELVHTERDFVKVLRDVAEGYVAECRKRKDMFSKEQIDTIFINLEEILKFQLGFLKDLEAAIDWETPHKSCVGSCFLKHKNGFTMYSDYCNSHPVATATLQELYQYNNYSKFFEACRLMRGLIEIPLDGYLLTPVQRICKYPLQLAELLKYTKADHPDYTDIKEALQVMKGVAVLINERKRRMESLEKLAAWQLRVEGWEGEDLIETSSQLIHQGEVIRVKTGMWTNNIILFLFDHQVVYCKKDLLKRNTYVYKGRLSLDTTEVIDVSDGKDIHLGVTVRHAIKLYSCLRDKWLLFCCRSSSEKQKWLQAFTEERKSVVRDKNDGLEFPAAARQLARVAARCQRRPPRKPRGDKSYKHDSGYMGSSLQLTSSNSLGRRVGTWFTFGGNKKSRHQHRDRDIS